jgi:hypothetical protein
MRMAGRWLLLGWWLASLVLLGMDGRLTVSIAWTAPASLLRLGLGALIRQQLMPSTWTGRRCRSTTGWPTISASRSRPW